MIIHLSQFFSSNILAKPSSQHGVVYQNLSAFLALLESHLGLAYPDISQTQRVIQYLHCLQQKDNNNRFYHQSLKIDELGVAKQLLSWRDELYLSGWNGQSFKQGSKRLKDLGEVEKIAKDELAINTGQQLENIKQQLANYQTQIKQIELYDDINLLPKQWQQVLNLLKQQGVLINTPKCATKRDSANSDLNKLQTALTQEKSVTFSDDGSVLIFRSQSKANTAQMLAQYLSGHKKVTQTAILAEQEQSLLIEQFVQYNVPRTSSFQLKSASRSILQLMPLSFQLLWNPINLNSVLAFLQHPDGFIPKFAREILASTIASFPGIGGKHLQEAYEKIRKAINERAYSYNENELIESIEYWINSEPYDVNTGIPIELLISRIDKVSAYHEGQVKYISKQLDPDKGENEFEVNQVWINEQKRNLHYQAIANCDELSTLLALLSAQKNTHISQLKLKQLLEMFTTSGITVNKYNAQVNAPIITDSSVQIIETIPELVWWDMRFTNHHQHCHWLPSEMDYLLTQNIDYPDLAEQLIAKEQSDIAAINKVKNRFIIILHEGEEHHPIWDKITTLCKDYKIINLEQAIQNPRAKLIPEIKIKKITQQALPLPGKQRWWLLENGKQLTKREVESFSSLDAFIKSPYQWVLNYKARLRAGNIQTISEGNQLKGTFTHELFENFFTHYEKSWQKLSQKNLEQWFEQQFEEMIMTQAVVFLTPGNISEKEVFRETIYKALTKLIEHLKSARIKSIKIEEPNEAKFFAGKISGYIDMKLTNDKGEEIVLDLKWGSEKYKKQDLKNNLHSQLALYAFMRKTITQAPSWPEQAYFIIESANLLAQNKFVFPNADVCAPEPDETVATLYKQLENTYQWRRQQLNRGEIEMTINGTEQTPNSISPDNAIPIDNSNDYFNDYVNLMGWEQ